MLINQLVWNNSFALVAVGELLREKMRNGSSPRTVRSEHGLRAITLTAVTQNSFSDKHTKFVAINKDKVQDLWLEPGDIFVQRSNTSELVGTTAIYSGQRSWAIFPDLLIRLRANTELVDPEYLAVAMRSERAHGVLRAKAKGLAGSMPKIDQRTIGTLRVPIPPLERQRYVVQQAREIDDLVSRVVGAHDDNVRRAEALRYALLRAAYSGRLRGRAVDVETGKENAGV